jgi:hypothetical protein
VSDNLSFFDHPIYSYARVKYIIFHMIQSPEVNNTTVSK